MKHIILSFVLVTALVAVSAAHTPVYAKEKRKKEKKRKPNYTRAIIKPFKEGKKALEKGKLEQARNALTKIDEIVAKKTPTQDDLFVISNFRYSLGKKLQDKDMTFKGLKGMYDSGLSGREEIIGPMLYDLLYKAGKEEEAVSYLHKTAQAKPNNPNVHIFLAQYYRRVKNLNQAEQSIRHAIGIIEAKKQKAPEDWYKMWLGLAHEAKNRKAFSLGLVKLVNNYPNKDNWSDAVYSFHSTPGLKESELLDSYRLLGAVNALQEIDDVLAYGEAANDAFAYDETLRVLSNAEKAGVASAAAQEVRELRAIAVKNRSQFDQATMKSLEGRAQRSKRAREAMNVGNISIARGEYEKAARFFGLAAEKGNANNKQLATLRRGIAYALTKKNDNALAMFAEITAGKFLQLAQLWTVYSKVEQAKADQAREDQAKENQAQGQ